MNCTNAGMNYILQHCFSRWPLVITSGISRYTKQARNLPQRKET